MNLEAAVSRAVARMQVDGIVGWGLRFAEPGWAVVDMGNGHGCTTSQCRHHSHDPYAADYKVYPLEGTVVALGHEEGGDSSATYFVVRAPGGDRYYRLESSLYFWATLVEIPAAGVPEYLLAGLAS